MHGVTKFSLAAQPCVLPATLQSRPVPWTLRISLYEASFSFLCLELAGQSSSAPGRQRPVEARPLGLVFASVAAFLGSLATELVG